jgi:hypothetical protein
MPLEDDLGATRRLLFPSPRKDGVPKILGELEVNLVQGVPHCPQPKAVTLDKENVNIMAGRATTPSPPEDDDLDQELFGTPPVHPSTPTSKLANRGVFKTPTRQTPSHRPITRSISKSIRSTKSVARSPMTQTLFQLQRTPSKTPGSGRHSAIKRRTPRNVNLHAHFAVLDDAAAHFESPFTATLNQLLSEANEFTAGSPSHGLVDLDLTSLPNIDSDGVVAGAHGDHHGALDFATFLSTDIGMPSSPPGLNSAAMADFTSHGQDIWAELEGTTAGKLGGH